MDPLGVRTVLTAKGAREAEIWKAVSLPLMCKCFGKAALLPDHSAKGAHP